MSEEQRDSTLVQTFKSLGPDTKDCFRLFARSGANNYGCFVLGQWARFVAKEYVKSSATLKEWGTAEHPLEAIVINDTLSKEIIRDCLLRRGVSVEYYEREAGGGAYTCAQRGSPGNIADFEASLFEFEETEIQLMASGALVFGTSNSNSSSGGGVSIGFATLNTTLRQLLVAEYTDTYQLASLDALVAQTTLKELTLCCATAAELEEERVRMVRRLCERANVTLQVLTLRELRQRQKSSATTRPLEELSGLLRVPEETIILNSLSLASQAMENLLSTSVDLMDPNNQHAFYLKRITPSTYMRLDSAAMEALNLVSRKPEPRGVLPQSIFTWLNRCQTGMGSRMMRQWLLQPLRNPEEINQRLAMVETFLESPMLRDTLTSEVLRRCSDMDRLNRKLQRRSLALKDTASFLSFVQIIPEAIRVLKLYSGQNAKLLMNEYIAPLEDIHEHMSNLKTLIEATVDFSDRNTARINSAFDDELQEMNDQLQEIQRGIDKEYGRVLSKYEWNEKQLKYEYHGSYGYVFRVSRKEDRQLRSSKELITVSTAKDGVRFTSEKLSALSNQYRDVSEEYDRRQQDLKGKLVDTIATYLPVLDDTKEMIAALDVFVAWSLVVKDSPRAMTKPVVRRGSDAHSSTDTTQASAGVKQEGQETKSDAGASAVTSPNSLILSLKGVRHPLVELRRPDYIANDVLLTAGANGLIITGPNMGGKSTYMRSAGVAVVLAQAGCYVPAEAAELQVRDAVMCRVGATDHLGQGVSTFMVEMLESAAILSGATEASLAIVDELGRGTSTYDGFGLAWAIAHEIAVKIKAALLFSTHFHELTALPARCGHVSNVHFGANVNEAEETLQFSYKLEPGPCGRSYGLYVAALAHMPAEVVQNAKRKAAELEHFEVAGGSGEADALNGDALLKTDSAVVRRIASYAKRIREVSADIHAGAADAGAAKRLRDEISQDAAAMTLIAR